MSELMKTDLHPRLARRSWESFEQGDGAGAISAALDEVESAVRSASRLDGLLRDADLMRAAFEPGYGPLADRAKPFAKQEETANLFAGAFLVYREEPAPEPEEAAEVLRFLSSLLDVVEPAPTVAAASNAS